MGMLTEFSLWPWMKGQKGIPVPSKHVIEETSGCSCLITADSDRSRAAITARRDRGWHFASGADATDHGDGGLK
jgi:hypothetical protein